jgi:hypothetical protein
MNIEVKDKKATNEYNPSSFMIRCSTFDIQGSTKLSIACCDTAWQLYVSLQKQFWNAFSAGRVMPIDDAKIILSTRHTPRGMIVWHQL